MALRYQNPGALAPYVYVYTLYGLIYDVVIFNIVYNGITWLGIGVVLTAFMYHVSKQIEDNAVDYVEFDSDSTGNGDTQESPRRMTVEEMNNVN